MIDVVNFTNCRQFAGKIKFDENDNIERLRLKVQYNGLYYDLKFGPHYFYRCISEYLGCSIFNAVGVQAQNVLLGVYEYEGRELPAVACQSFNTKNLYLLTMAEIIKGDYDTDFGRNILKEVQAFRYQQIYDEDKLKNHFWKMFMADALIGTADRSEGDWGVFVDRKNFSVVDIAPVFNCYSCLCGEKLDNNIVLRQNVLEQDNYDTTALVNASGYMVDGKQVSYFEFLLMTDNIDCLGSLEEFVKKIEKLDLDKIVNNVFLLSEKEKRFYKDMLALRKGMILAIAKQRNCVF